MSTASLEFRVYSLLLYRKQVESELRDLVYERTYVDSSPASKANKEALIQDWNKRNAEKQNLRKDIIDTIQDISSSEEGSKEVQKQLKTIEYLENTSSSGTVFTQDHHTWAHRAIIAYKDAVEAKFEDEHRRRRQSVVRSPPPSVSTSSHQESLVASTPAVSQTTSLSSRTRPDISFIPKVVTPTKLTGFQFQEDPEKIHLASQSRIDLSSLGASGPSVIPESFTLHHTIEEDDDKLQQTVLQGSVSGYQTGQSVSLYPTLAQSSKVVLDLQTPARHIGIRNPPVKRLRDVCLVADPSVPDQSQAKRAHQSHTPVSVRPPSKTLVRSPPVPIILQPSPRQHDPETQEDSSESDTDLEEEEEQQKEDDNLDSEPEDPDMPGNEGQQQSGQDNSKPPPGGERQNPGDGDQRQPLGGAAYLSSNTIVSYQPPAFTVLFSGDTNVNDFIRNYDNYFSALNFNDSQKLKQLFFHLTGAAYNCLRIFSDHTVGGLTYKAACERLKQFFRSKVTKEEFGRLLRQRKFTPPESLETYYWDVVRLCERCSIFDQQDMVQQIIKGLPNTIGSQIWSREPKDTAELYDLLVRFSSYESLIGKRSSTLSSEDVTTLTDELVNKLNKMGFYKKPKPNRRRRQPQQQGKQFNNQTQYRGNWNNGPRPPYNGPPQYNNSYGRSGQNRYESRGGNQNQQYPPRYTQPGPRYNQNQRYSQGPNYNPGQNQRQYGNNQWFQQRQRSGYQPQNPGYQRRAQANCVTEDGNIQAPFQPQNHAQPGNGNQ